MHLCPEKKLGGVFSFWEGKGLLYTRTREVEAWNRPTSRSGLGLYDRLCTLLAATAFFPAAPAHTFARTRHRSASPPGCAPTPLFAPLFLARAKERAGRRARAHTTPERARAHACAHFVLFFPFVSVFLLHVQPSLSQPANQMFDSPPFLFAAAGCFFWPRTQTHTHALSPFRPPFFAPFWQSAGRERVRV